MYFIEEMAELSLPIVEGYVERNAQYTSLKTDTIVRSYWKLIKEIARILKTKKHVLCFPRSQRAEFLETLGAKDILKQMETL